MSARASVFRSLLNEVRLTHPDGVLKKDALVVQFVKNQYKKYETTDQTLCKAREEMKFIGDTYLCYLSSLRKQLAINKEYNGGGERTVKDTASLVGFKLPHDPK